MEHTEADLEGAPHLVRTWWELSRQLDQSPTASRTAAFVAVGVGSASLFAVSLTLSVLMISGGIG
ncbi:MAG: hypothetical protein ABEJ71_01575 [Halodesulfurarchaeum sp.]